MDQKQPLLSFHGKQEVKDYYVQRVLAHQKADEIVKGQYWKNGKGCAVGCTLHSGKHDAYDTELGITWRLALLEDSIFEQLPNAEAKKFPLEFLESMPVGVDTNKIFKDFIIWNLSDEKDGLIYHIKDKKAIALLTEIADTYKKSLTEEIPQTVWAEFARRANSAYAYASASAYAYAYAYASADADAYAYASADASADAYAYASAYAYADASADAYAYASAYAYAYAYASAYASASADWQTKFAQRILLMRDKLIHLIKTAK